MQIKNKEKGLKLLQDEIVNLKETIESIQLKLDKEISEHQRLSKEFSKINIESMVWASEKYALKRKVIKIYL